MAGALIKNSALHEKRSCRSDFIACIAVVTSQSRRGPGRADEFAVSGAGRATAHRLLLSEVEARISVPTTIALGDPRAPPYG
jgi:hypothetical protein